MICDAVITSSPAIGPVPSLGAVAAPDQFAAVKAALAAVPQYFRLAQTASPGCLVWLLASDSAWPEQALAASRQGAGIIIVDQPGCVTPESIGQLAGADCPVVLNSGASHAPQLRGLATQLDGRQLDWIDYLTVVPAQESNCPRGALFATLATLATAGLEPTAITSIQTGPTSLVAELTSPGTQWHLTTVTGDNLLPKTTIKCFGTFGSLEATMSDPDVAFPGEVIRIDSDGAAVQTTDYQTPRRLALREAYAYLTSGQEPPCELRRFTAIAQLVDQWAWGSGSLGGQFLTDMEHS